MAATARAGLNRAVKNLAWALVVAGLAMAGLGLLLAAVLIALSQLMGPLLAFGLMGFILLLLAVLIAVLPHARPVSPPPRALAPDELAFNFGFALGRMFFGRSQ